MVNVQDLWFEVQGLGFRVYSLQMFKGLCCCSVLQCVAVCCSVLQCVAVWFRV